MADLARHDAWGAGESYDAYMGRWSRQVAPHFLDRLGTGSRLDWLDIACGTGALSGAILARCEPRSVLGIDASAGFVARAREALADPRAAFEVGDAGALPVESGSRDAVVSALAMNFVPDRGAALAEMRRVARAGGRVGFYVWDYPGGGLEFVRLFWAAAVALDPRAADLAEGRRFSFCEPDALSAMATAVGLGDVACAAIEAPTVFRDFGDFWRPFTLGAGPAPGYCASLAPEALGRLRESLRAGLLAREDGAIALKVRAWAVTATAD